MPSKQLRAERLSRCDRAHQRCLVVDMYRQPFRFVLPDDQDQYRTFLGSMLSIFTIMLITAYAGYKFYTLWTFNDFKVQIRQEENAFETGDAFTSHTHSFQIAAGLSAYDGSMESIEDPEIGEVKFYIKRFDSADESVPFGFNEVPSQNCVSANFLNDKDDSNGNSPFFKTNSISVNDLANEAKKLKCLSEDVELFGNFDSNKASNLLVVFEKCTEANGRKCKSPEEIDKFLTGKYIVVLENETKFISQNFGEDRIDQRATTRWFSLSNKNRIEYVRRVLRSDLQLNDSYFNLSNLSTVNVEGFLIERAQNRELPYDNAFHNAVTYEMNLDRKVYFRRVYSILDFLRDIGGLFGALTPLFSSIVISLQYHSGFLYLMGELYTDKLGEQTANLKLATELKRRNKVQWRCREVLKLNCLQFCPRKLLSRCCNNRRNQMLLNSYYCLRREVEISHILMLLRVLKSHAKSSFASRKEWKEYYNKEAFKGHQDASLGSVGIAGASISLELSSSDGSGLAVSSSQRVNVLPHVKREIEDPRSAMSSSRSRSVFDFQSPFSSQRQSIIDQVEMSEIQDKVSSLHNESGNVTEDGGREKHHTTRY